MSSNGLPPRTASLAERLQVAMSLAGYSQVRLAKELETDRSLIWKWLNGRVLEVKSPRHQQGLARALNTPADYWLPIRPRST